jgi:hypothetical protein
MPCLGCPPYHVSAFFPQLPRQFVGSVAVASLAVVLVRR